MAQAGQYNYGRCMKRGDSQAAYLACAEFIKTAMSAVYLLNEAYMPYYKWIFRGAEAGFLCCQGEVRLLAELTQIHRPDGKRWWKGTDDRAHLHCSGA